MINIKSSSRYKINKKEIKDFIKNYLISKKYLHDFDINLIFVGKKKMKKINQEYKKENIALPILTFYYNEKIEDRILLGEIFLCYPQVILLAAQRNKKVDTMILELIKHGLDNLIKQ